MNPHKTQDTLEQRRWDKHQADMDKDDWISKRADELSLQWPATLNELKNPFLPLSVFAQAVESQKVSDAYEGLIWEICLNHAESEWTERWMLGEVA